MIKLIPVPTIAMDVAMYSAAITSPETTESAVNWILKESKEKRGTGMKKGSIKIKFFNHALREPIEVRYVGDSLMGRIPDEISKYSVVDIRAKLWGMHLPATMNYAVFIMDPNSKEHSALRDDGEDELDNEGWED